MLVAVMARLYLYADRGRDRACADADRVGDVRGDAVGVIVGDVVFVMLMLMLM